METEDEQIEGIDEETGLVEGEIPSESDFAEVAPLDPVIEEALETMSPVLPVTAGQPLEQFPSGQNLEGVVLDNETKAFLELTPEEQAILEAERQEMPELEEVNSEETAINESVEASKTPKQEPEDPAVTIYWGLGPKEQPKAQAIQEASFSPVTDKSMCTVQNMQEKLEINCVWDQIDPKTELPEAKISVGNLDIETLNSNEGRTHRMDLIWEKAASPVSEGTNPNPSVAPTVP